MDETIEWLLEGSAWVEYKTRLDLLFQDKENEDVIESRKRMLHCPEIKSLIAELQDWPGSVLTSHKNAGHLIHKLTFLADLGIRNDDLGVGEIIGKIFRHRSPQGPFQVLMNIPSKFGGLGTDQFAWALCDAPVILYSLAKMGLQEDARVLMAVEYLAKLVRDNGWPCNASPELGSFRGPGRKEDPCPYATLIMTKLLLEIPEFRRSNNVSLGVESLLSLWERRRDYHPYIFYMGTDFSKLKCPEVWFDILHVLDVVSRSSTKVNDHRINEMIEIVESKRTSSGRFIPESVWMAWKGWEFGQKKEPSCWLTLQVLKILDRCRAGGPDFSRILTDNDEGGS